MQLWLFKGSLEHFRMAGIQCAAMGGTEHGWLAAEPSDMKCRLSCCKVYLHHPR